MSSWSESLLLASRDGALLALTIGVLLPLAGRHISAGWRHGLWLLVPLRLMMPVLPTSPVSWQRVMPVEKLASSFPQPTPTGENSISAPVPVGLPVNPSIDVPVMETRPITPIEQPSEPITKWEIAGAIWLLGTAGCLGLGAFLTIRFSRRLKRFVSVNHPRKRELEAMLAEFGSEFGWRKYPAVRVTEAVEVPALFGVLRPEILVPPSALERLSETELRLVLLHELGHWRRKDLWVNLTLALLQAVHWFNPLVWWAFHRTRVESERATDAWVLHRAGVGHVTDYGEMLLHVLDHRSKPRMAFSGMVSVVESPKDLRRRMVGIGRFSGKRSRLAVAGSMVLLLGLAAVGLTQPPKPEDESRAAAILKPDATDSLICKVSSSSGIPVPDAEVFLEVVSNIDGAPLTAVALAGKTDSAGSIAIPVRPEWRATTYLTLHLYVQHSKEGYAAISKLIPPRDSSVEMVLTKGLPLRFRVLDEKSVPVSNLRLRVANAQTPVFTGDFTSQGPRFWGRVPSLPSGFWDAVTDPQGHCTIEGLPPGAYYVDHNDPAYGQIPGAHDTRLMFNPETQEAETELMLLPASMVSGTVKLPDGKPVAGVKVETLEHFRYKNGGSFAEDFTDANGHYELQRLLPGDYDVAVRLNGNLGNDWTADVVDISLKVGEHRKHVNPNIVKGALASGKVTLADTNAAVNDTLVTVTTKAASSLHSWSVKTDSSGHYQLRVPPGKRKVYVSGGMPDGYARSSEGEGKLEMDLVLEEGGTYTANFALRRESQIRGVVVNASGEPVAGASVSCLKPTDGGLPFKVVSDDAGKFSIVLPAGTESAQLMAESGNMLSAFGATFPVTDEAKLELLGNAYANATGRVVDGDGRPIKGARVSWSSVEMGMISNGATTDAEGRFEAQKLWPGKRIVFYGSKDGYGENSSSASFDAGQSVELETIILPKADATVSGKVVDSKGNPVEGVLVKASGYLQPDKIEATTNAAGRFNLRGVVAGWLDVKATRREKIIAFVTQKRVRTGREDIVIVLRDEPWTGKIEALVDQVGKPAPPLTAQSWFHTDPLPAHQPGKVRLIQFVGLDRPLIFFSNTLPPLQKLREELPEPELEIIVVHGAWPKEEVAEILAKDYPDFKIPLAIEPEEGAMSKAFGVQHWLTVVIDQQGKVAFQSRGDWGQARKKVRMLLGKE